MTDFDLEQRIEQRLPPAIRSVVDRLDGAVAGFMERFGVSLLRIAVALVFVWFGTLKVIDRSPVENLVKDTVYFLPEDTFFFVLGVWEIVVGLGLLLPAALRLTLLLFWAQMAGTFLVLVVHPDLSFQGDNLFLLTLTGEFVVKNMVLMAAGLIIGSTVRARRQPDPLPRSS